MLRMFEKSFEKSADAPAQTSKSSQIIPELCAAKTTTIPTPTPSLGTSARPVSSCPAYAFRSVCAPGTYPGV